MKQKTSEILATQLEKFESAYGYLGQVLPKNKSAADFVSMALEEIKDKFPVRYQAYLSTVRQETQVPPIVTEKLGAVLRLASAVQEMDSFQSKRSLFAHQIEVFRGLLDFFEQGERQGWIKLPTGSGKTAIFVSLAAILDVPTVILVPRKDLITQTVKAWGKFAGDIHDLGTFYSDKKDTDKKIIITTYQSLKTFLASLPEDSRFPLVICDEAHRSLNILKAIDSIPGQIARIGLTATPDFNDQKSVRHEFGTLIHEMHLSEAIQSGICSGARVLYIKTTSELQGIKGNGRGDFSEKQLAKELDIGVRNEAALRVLGTEELAKRLSVVTCLSLNQAEALSAEANKRGIASAFVHGGLSKTEREEIYGKFERREIRAIFAVDLLTEGWDCPAADALLNLRPTASLVVAEQRGGRVLRLSEGKEFAIILEFVDSHQPTNGIAPITMVEVLGGTAVLPPGIDIDGAVERLQKQVRERFAVDNMLHGFEVMIEETEILSVSDEMRKGSEAQELQDLSLDYFKQVLDDAELTPQHVHTQKVTWLLKTKISTPEFSGSFAKLCKLYFSSQHSQKINPTSESVRTMYAELYGADPFPVPAKESTAISEEVAVGIIAQIKADLEASGFPEKIGEMLRDRNRIMDYRLVSGCTISTAVTRYQRAIHGDRSEKVSPSLVQLHQLLFDLFDERYEDALVPTCTVDALEKLSVQLLVAPIDEIFNAQLPKPSFVPDGCERIFRIRDLVALNSVTSLEDSPYLKVKALEEVFADTPLASRLKVDIRRLEFGDAGFLDSFRPSIVVNSSNRFPVFNPLTLPPLKFASLQFWFSADVAEQSIRGWAILASYGVCETDSYLKLFKNLTSIADIDIEHSAIEARWRSVNNYVELYSAMRDFLGPNGSSSGKIEKEIFPGYDKISAKFEVLFDQSSFDPISFFGITKHMSAGMVSAAVVAQAPSFTDEERQRFRFVEKGKVDVDWERYAHALIRKREMWDSGGVQEVFREFVRTSLDSSLIEDIFCVDFPQVVSINLIGILGPILRPGGDYESASGNIHVFADTNLSIKDEFHQICLSEVDEQRAAKIVNHLLTNRARLKDQIDLNMEVNLFAGEITLKDLIGLTGISDEQLLSFTNIEKLERYERNEKKPIAEKLLVSQFVDSARLRDLLIDKLGISEQVAPVEELDFASIVKASALALKARDPGFKPNIKSLGAIPVESSCIPASLRTQIKTFADLAFIARERGIYEDSAPVSDTATQDERNAAAKSFLLKTKLAEVLINTFRV